MNFVKFFSLKINIQFNLDFSEKNSRDLNLINPNLSVFISRMQTADNFLDLDLVAKLFKSLLLNLQDKNERMNEIEEFSSTFINKKIIKNGKHLKCIIFERLL